MAILDSALGMLGFTRKASTGTTAIEDAIENDIYASVTVNPYQAFKFFQESSAVAIAVEMIASKVESIQPVVRVDDGDLDDSHPILDMINSPNPLQTRRQFIGDVVRHYLVTSNAFILWLGAQNSKNIELWPIHPVGVMPESTFRRPWPEVIRVPSDFGQGAYRAEEIDGQIAFRDGPLRELTHTKGFCSRRNALLADSPLEAICKEIQQQDEGKNHNLSLLRNGGRPSLIFNFKNSFATVEAFKDAMKYLQKQFKGSKNAGNIAGVNSEEMDIVEAGINNKDMDFAILDEASRSVVFSRYKVPLPLVTSSRQTFSNFEEALVAFYYDAIIPTFEDVYQTIGRTALRRTAEQAKVEITYDPHSIPAIHEEMLQEAKLLAEMAVMTKNEQRAQLPGLDGLEGGDVLLAPSTLQPVAGEGVDLAAMMAEDRELQDEMARSAMKESDENANDDPAEGGRSE